MRRTATRLPLLLIFLVGLAVGARAQTAVYFPQVADGAFSGGYFTTTIFVANNSLSNPANVTITFTRSDGQAFPIAFVDADNNPVAMAGNVMTVPALGPRQSRKFVSTAMSGDLLVGFARVDSNIPVAASAIFSQFGGTPGSGTLLSEAAVVPATPGTTQAIIVDESAFRSGFAYANPSPTVPATINFDLLNSSAISTVATTRILPAMNHQSIFVDELFTPPPAGHVGTLHISSAQPIVVTSLRFSGNLFTTVPPFTVAGIMSTIENWLQPGSLPGPLATVARLITSIGYGLG
jgi:hypothetical protein